MSRFEYSDDEMDLNKVLKMNQDISKGLLNDTELSSSREKNDANIASSIELLRSLGKTASIENLTTEINDTGTERKLEHRPTLEPWDKIVSDANDYIEGPVVLEDIMTEAEIQEAFKELKSIEKEFSRKTSIINKTDLSFLAIATALQVAKSLIFPYVAEKFDYGKEIDKSKRLDHNNKSIKDSQKEANEKFKNKHSKNNKEGYWIEMLYRPPAYDITNGSKELGINMGGAYHRLYTLGHDPILGWVFGTMNILTDVVTLNTLQSYRVTRRPTMKIIKEYVPMGVMVKESYDLIKNDFLNLPAAIFAEAQHLKSDKYTKLGLPIPILSTLNENFASKLYKSNYDALCLARDLKIVGASFIVSKIFDMIISIVHGLFRKDEIQDIFEVRTRKILLISNSIASTSTIINASITSNPKNLDIGSLLNTITHLFTDIRFIAKIKKEFIESEISDRLQKELDEIDRLYEEI